MLAIFENSPYIGLFLLLILGGLGIPFFPQNGTLLVCGVLLNTGVVKILPALFVVYLGVLLGDFIIYHFGKKYGRRVITHRWFHRFLPRDKLLTLEEKFKQKGTYVVVLGRHLIGARVQVLLVSGILKMPVLKFLLADVLTITFTIVLWTAMGYGGGHNLRDFVMDVIRRIPFLPL